MAERRLDGFFYGLFMDADLLRQSGATPINPRSARACDFALHIGLRATLVASVGDWAYRMLFSLTHDELDRLYGAADLEQYRPEAVIAHTHEGLQPAPSLCYKLRGAPAPAEANPEYAARLRAALVKLRFPADYIATIA